MVKLIVFDWDDVITLGAKQGYFACYDAALLAVAVELPEAEKTKRILARWGKPFAQVLELLLAEHPQLQDQAVASFEKHFTGETFVSQLTMIPGTITTLKTLATDYQLAVATGNHPEMIQRIMKKFQIPSALFKKIISSFEVAPDQVKPHPFMLEKLMNELQISKSETIYVGDAATDVIMAKNAGVLPVVVLTGHLNQEQAKALKVKEIIPNINHLPRILTSISCN
ncbi:MAG: HAD family hydrolase [bacterium]